MKYITDINELADAIHANAREKGFHPEDEKREVYVANQCNNMHAEVTELWDSYRGGYESDPCDKQDKMDALGLPTLTAECEEVADIIIRALDVSRRLGIDIVRAINIKMAYNATRPYKHGKKN